MTVSVNWMSNTLVSLTFLSLIQQLGETGTFMIYFSISLIGLVFFYFKLPETKGKKLEDIEKIFQTDSQSKTNQKDKKINNFK